MSVVRQCSPKVVHVQTIWLRRLLSRRSLRDQDIGPLPPPIPKLTGPRPCRTICVHGNRTETRWQTRASVPPIRKASACSTGGQCDVTRSVMRSACHSLVLLHVSLNCRTRSPPCTRMLWAAPLGGPSRHWAARGLGMTTGACATWGAMGEGAGHAGLWRCEESVQGWYCATLNPTTSVVIACVLHRAGGGYRPRKGCGRASGPFIVLPKTPQLNPKMVVKRACTLSPQVLL